MSRAGKRRQGATTTGAVTADPALALRAEDRMHEVKEDSNGNSSEGCFKGDADIQQMIRYTKDVKGTDKEATNRRHIANSGEQSNPRSREKSTPAGKTDNQQQRKNIPNSRVRKEKEFGWNPKKKQDDAKEGRNMESRKRKNRGPSYRAR